MKINILIHNDNGELLDKQLHFRNLQEMRKYLWENSNIDALIDEAEKNGNEDGMIDSTSEEDTYDGSSREDLIMAGEII